MFARKVSMQLKPGAVAQFKDKIENEIIPELRKQKGFLDEITFLYPSGKEAHAFSIWETAEISTAKPLSERAFNDTGLADINRTDRSYSPKVGPMIRTLSPALRKAKAASQISSAVPFPITIWVVEMPKVPARVRRMFRHSRSG